MPRTTFSTDNVRQSATSFPKLKLVHDEVVRLVIIESGPTYEWSHELRKPKISTVTRKPVMITKKRKNEEEYQDFDYEFIGNPICLGDPDVLDEQGVDTVKCPMCKLALEDSEAFRGPQRRFAVHVLKYKTKAGTPDVSEPFSVECLVWGMSDNRFTKVTQAIAEWADGDEDADPRKVDLILGPCTNAGYQNYDIHAGRRCEMLKSKERLERAMLTYQENHAPDLTPYCGRLTEPRWIKNMIEEVQERWAEIKTGGSPVQPVDISDTLDSSLLDTVPVTSTTRHVSQPQASQQTGSQQAGSQQVKPAFVPPPAEDLPGEGDPLNEFLPGGSAQELLPEPTAEESDSTPTESKSHDTKSQEKVDFTSLLADLQASLPGGSK